MLQCFRFGVSSWGFGLRIWVRDFKLRCTREVQAVALDTRVLWDALSSLGFQVGVMSGADEDLRECPHSSKTFVIPMQTLVSRPKSPTLNPKPPNPSTAKLNPEPLNPKP